LKALGLVHRADAPYTITDLTLRVAAVFDGHGQLGRMASAYAAAEMGRLLKADARMAPEAAGSARRPRRRASIDLRMDGTRQPLAALRDACVQVRRAAPRARPQAPAEHALRTCTLTCSWEGRGSWGRRRAVAARQAAALRG